MVYLTGDIHDRIDSGELEPERWPEGPDLSDAGQLADALRSAGLQARPPEGAVRSQQDLVRLTSDGSFGLVLGEKGDDGFEVELLGPEDEEFSVTVPAQALAFLRRADPAALSQSLLSGETRLTFLRLEANWGVRVARSFTAYVGRGADQALEVWYEGGLQRAAQVATLTDEQPAWQELLEALTALLRTKRPVPDAQDAPTLEGWRWSLELFAGEQGLVMQGSDEAPAALMDLVDVLAHLGCGCRCDEQRSCASNY